MKVIFNEENHTYTLGDKTLISVTQLLKKHGLSTDYSGVDAEILERAAHKGSAVHKEIEEYIKSGDVGFTSELSDYIELAKDLHFEADESEFVLPFQDIPDDEIDKYICAGTADLIGTCNGKEATIIDIKTTQKVDMRSCAWQLSLYERLAGVVFSKMYIFHLGKKSKAIPIKHIPATEIDRLLECERNGEIYHEPVLAVSSDLIACAEAAERELKLAEAEAKAAKATAEKYRQQLYEAMGQQGVSSCETADKSMLVTRIGPSTKTTIDSERLRADLPEIAERYEKVSAVKGYVRITIRE